MKQIIESSKALSYFKAKWWTHRSCIEAFKQWRRKKRKAGEAGGTKRFGYLLRLWSSSQIRAYWNQEWLRRVKAFLPLHFLSIPLSLLTFLCGERKKQNDKDEQDPTNPRFLHVDSTPPSLLYCHSISFDSYGDQVRRTRQLKGKR